MTEVIIVSLTMGFISSWHCAGMCGPLIVSMPGVAKTPGEEVMNTLMYHAGRIMLYAAGGWMVGMIGRQLPFRSSQQQLSVWLGALVLLYVLIPKRFFARINQWTRTDGFFDWVKLRITQLWHRPGIWTRFILGLLNGLLPCGMVYLAWASALATGTPEKSLLFMIGFGAGTFPMLAAIGYAGKVLRYKLRLQMQRAVPFLWVTMACLLMLRGLGLGIPFLSPSMKITDSHKPACCTRPAE